MTDDEPSDLPELLALFRDHAQGRWGIWHVEADGRSLYFGRQLYHPNGERKDTRFQMPFTKTEVCCRCGHGRAWEWPPLDPTLYQALRWVTLCLHCLGFYVGIWPSIFPRLRLGVRSQRIKDFRAPPERFGQKVVFPIRAADWYRQQPFGPGDEIRNPWAHSMGPRFPAKPIT